MPFADDAAVAAVQANGLFWQSLIAAVSTFLLAALQVWARRGATDAVEAYSKASAARAAVVKTDLSTHNAESAGRIGAVQAGLEVNTVLTAETKGLVNGQRAALVARIAELESRLAGKTS